jgi:hypothetical protein
MVVPRSPNWAQKADSVELVISAGDHFLYGSVHTMVQVLVLRGSCAFAHKAHYDILVRLFFLSWISIHSLDSSD